MITLVRVRVQTASGDVHGAGAAAGVGRAGRAPQHGAAGARRGAPPHHAGQRYRTALHCTALHTCCCTVAVRGSVRLVLGYCVTYY